MTNPLFISADPATQRLRESHLPTRLSDAALTQKIAETAPDVSGIVAYRHLASLDNISAPRPAGWEGAVIWYVREGQGVPIHARDGDEVITVGWSPAALPGMIAWYDAKNLPAGEVSSWADRGPRQLHATQSVAALRPVRVADGIHGRPAVKFDGVDDVLTTENTDEITGPVTVYMVAQLGSLAGATSEAFFDGGLRGESSTPSALRLYYAQASGAWYLRRGATITEITGGTPDLEPHLHKITVNGESSEVWVDGTLVTSGPAGTDPFNMLSLGARANGAGAWIDAQIGEALFVEGTLSAEDDTRVTEYLTSMWGL